MQDEVETQTRHRRSRRRRHERGERTSESTRSKKSRPVNIGSEVKAWLKVLDAVLVGVEKTAWSVRGVADEVLQAWNVAEGDVQSFREDMTGSGKGLVRLTRTGFVLGQIAASYRLFGLRSAFLSERKAEALLTRMHEQNAQRFYGACIEHGGAFLKVGQVLSARPDILPKPWVNELAQLQDAVPALPYETVRAVIEAELKAPIEKLFTSFEVEPLAAASIGQVHKAVTLEGNHVAVKIQRPGIAELVRLDLQALEMFLSSLRSSLPDLDYDTIVKEIRSAVIAELDYVEEAHMTRTVAEAFVGDENVVIPTPVADLCSGKVLTTTFIPGRKVTTVLDELAARSAEDPKAKAELSRILGRLLEAYLRQVLLFGAFQADPHPGNILVDANGKVAILDFGCAKTLLPEAKERYLDLMRSFLMGDKERMGTLFIELGFGTKSGRPDTLHLFADAWLSEFKQSLSQGKIEWPDKDDMMARATGLLKACEQDPVVTIPSDFVMITRVFGTLAGLFSHYEPDILFSEHIMPVLGQALFDAPAR